MFVRRAEPAYAVRLRSVGAVVGGMLLLIGLLFSGLSTPAPLPNSLVGDALGALEDDGDEEGGALELWLDIELDLTELVELDLTEEDELDLTDEEDDEWEEVDTIEEELVLEVIEALAALTKICDMDEPEEVGIMVDVGELIVDEFVMVLF